MGDKPNHSPEPETGSMCTILVGKDNSCVEVSDGFCHLVGYSREELLLMKLEDLAAPGTADITTFNPSEATGCAHGLWLLVSRNGTRVLVKHESRVRNDDLLIQSRLELIGAGY